ncbi:exopolysaccharide biosynthesis polyprenyl glycosylphosphotransferase [Caulobacter sp. KR2-114]|uniref:exopolysaccharide biosynthesis polyprenyl glycosylphosphotransferase n=1 Tax=Caulobacter sp. KR2-114 TaxID=3400912 RepID=UPI003BFAC2EC
MSRIETPAAGPQDGRFAERAALPAEETAPGDPADRRGPMRPAELTPTRSRLQGWTLGVIFRLGDLAGVAGTVAVAGVVDWTTTPGSALDAVAPLVIAGAALMWSLGATRSYALGHSEGLARHLLRVGAGFGLAGVLLLGLVTAFKPAPDNVAALALWFCLAFVTLNALHAAWWLRVRRWRKAGRLTPNIVVVGATASAQRLIESTLKSHEVAVLGIFDDRLDRAPKRIGGVPVLGDLDALLNHRIMPYVDRVVIAVPSLARSRVSQLVQRLSVLPNEVMLLVDYDNAAGRSAALSRLADAPLAQMAGQPGDERRALVKRAQDVVIGSIALAVFAPVLLAVAVAVKLDSPGPIFFRQRRHGFNNEEILVWKFRSMRVESTDATASRQVTAGDDRVTRVGRFIRKTSLDELPQLLNVLKGEMSLVGPRPHAVGMKTGETESARLVAEYAHRHRMKPGMTGWAAIKGSRGPVDTPELVRRRVALDIEYIERQSFWRDLYIMAMTIPCLLGDVKAVR